MGIYIYQIFKCSAMVEMLLQTFFLQIMGEISSTKGVNIT